MLKFSAVIKMTKELVRFKEKNRGLNTILKKDDFDKLKAYAFELACAEADYLGIEKTGIPFIRLVDFRLADTIERTHSLIAKKVRNTPAEFFYGSLKIKRCISLDFLQSDEEIEKRVKRIYEGNCKTALDGIDLEDTFCKLEY